MSAELLGAHMPVAGGLGNAVRNGKLIGCTAVQVFTSSPQQWKSKPLTDDMVSDLVQAREETEISELISHDSYLINLCSPEPMKRAQSIVGMKSEMDRCARYGIRKVVSHMGAHMGQGEEEGLKAISESLLQVLAETDESVTVCMETTAGQGTALLHQFEHIAKILELVKGNVRAGVCLDTCHIFVAGYDIRNAEQFAKVFADFDRLVGIDRLKVIHCNDSKKGLGSKVDRHHNLGDGEIGTEAFKWLVNDARFTQIPIILETPIENEGHERDLALLRSFQT